MKEKCRSLTGRAVVRSIAEGGQWIANRLEVGWPPSAIDWPLKAIARRSRSIIDGPFSAAESRGTEMRIVRGGKVMRVRGQAQRIILAWLGVAAQILGAVSASASAIPV